jgi:hypothetical protein
MQALITATRSARARHRKPSPLRHLRLVCALWGLSLTAAPAAATPPPAALTPPAAPLPVTAPPCADFLQALSLQHPAAVFVGCQRATSGQLAALRATYAVRGVDAAAVEAHLIDRAALPALRFICCGWEGFTSFKPFAPANPLARDLAYQVAMRSGETTLSSRSDWPHIPSFEVEVLLTLESP